MIQARKLVVEQPTVFGPMLGKINAEGKNGKSISIPYIDPFAMLTVASSKTYMSALLERSLVEHPPSPDRPWSILFYSDEVTPGNVLKAQNHKKVQVIYWSFNEFGADALGKDGYWFTATVVRSSRVQDMEGGMSQLTSLILLTMFGSVHNLKTSGIRLVVNGREFRMFATLGQVPSDEDALHQMWRCKGASGTKMCVMCKSVVNKNWKAADQLGPKSYFVPYNQVLWMEGVWRRGWIWGGGWSG